jgi:site-specific DNA recombinase
MTVRAIGYVRVSTEEQAKEGMSIDAQSDKLRQYAELYDIELIDIIVDAGASAKTLDRTGLDRALAMLRAEDAEALLIYKLDRLTRSVVDLGQLISAYFQKYQLLSICDHIDTGSANGRLILNVLGSVAQWEREQISERITEALHYLRDNKRVYARIPLGYRDVDGNLLPINDEQLTVAEVFNLREKGLSLRQIANELNHRGVVGKRGGAFYASTIQKILNNPIHAAA